MPQEYKLILKYADQPGYTPDLECYLRHGGYEVLKKALAMKPKTLPDGKSQSPQEQIRQEVMTSGLRGRGGAGFSCGLKWSFVDRKSGKPVYLICNADESEPGTFKDRQIIYKDPHQLLEGTIIACFANDVHLAYIYIRGEMPDGAKLLNKCLQEARAKNLLGKNILGSGYDLEIHVHRGAGAYICGEETGLIESLEGKRAYPRIKPPFPATHGLFGCPTIVNNVETLACVPHIVARGADWFRSIGPEKSPGPKLFCISGHVVRPGTYELPMGTPLREIIYEHAGGIPNGRALKAVIPGGASMPVFTPAEIDVPMDMDSVQKAGSFLGSAGIMVMDDTVCMVWATLTLAHFFHHESCGQCTPCREGTGWLENVLHGLEEGHASATDVDLLLNIANNMMGNTICALADAAAMPVRAFVTKYRAEFEEHARLGRCPLKPRADLGAAEPRAHAHG
jgi:NADH-quinone oxidoreductase subunit F